VLACLRIDVHAANRIGRGSNARGRAGTMMVLCVVMRAHYFMPLCDRSEATPLETITP
jgi:hypothetical protein